MVLYAAPFSLDGGSDIYATVIAVNYYGSSVESEPGNGAKVVLVPDAPLLVRDDPSVTSATVAGLLWTDGVSNGGKSVIDYTISYD
jgi:hypothetical protein